jgi:hypothetical protein
VPAYQLASPLFSKLSEVGVNKQSISVSVLALGVLAFAVTVGENCLADETVGATAKDMGNGRRMVKILALEEQFRDQSYSNATWRPLTPENKMELTKTALLVNNNVDYVAAEVAKLLESEKNILPGRQNPFVCAAHGRLDPEIAIDLVRTALLTNGKIVDGRVVNVLPEEVANDFRKFCGQGEVTKIDWLNDQDCAEMIKISRLVKTQDFGTVLNAVKDMRGWEGFRGLPFVRGVGWKLGMNGNVATELVKAALFYKQPPTLVAKMFRDAYGYVPIFGKKWDLSPENAAAMVKAALAQGSTDVKPMLDQFSSLRGFYGLNRNGFLSTTTDSIAEMVKLSAVTKIPAKDIWEQTMKVYGWGAYQMMYGVTPDNAIEMVKLAHRSNPKVRILLETDHQYLAKPVDRHGCERRQQQAADNGAAVRRGGTDAASRTAQ